jgi:hypothetical protein
MIVRVSVLLPVYNCEAYLEQTLASLSAQTFGDFEVIAVNDGSSDGTRDILEAHAKVDARFLPVHKSNGGIVSALNTALSVASGEYSARIDGDDIARSDRFAKQVAFLETNPDCVSVGSLYRMIDATGSVTGEQAPFGALRQTDLSVFPPHVATLPHPSIMSRTAALREIGGYRTMFPHAEDMDMYLRLAKLGRLELIQEPLLDYRVHTGSLSSKHIEAQTDSSLLAILSAITVARGLPDPCQERTQVTRQDFYNALNDCRLPEFFETFRRLRRIEGHFNRQERSEGTRLAVGLLGDLARRAPTSLGDSRYRGLLKSNLRLLARRAVGRI